MDQAQLEHAVAVARVYAARSILARKVPRDTIQKWVAAAEELAAVAYDCARFERQIENASNPDHAEAMSAKLERLRWRQDELRQQTRDLLASMDEGVAEKVREFLG